MPIPKSFIETLRMSCDIESIVSSYVKLKRSGRNKTGLCPFHSEKTPSMVVYNDTQSFYCFGCGAGGDVISFIMRIENLGYVEAVKFLAQRVGLEVPDDGVEDHASKMKPIILEMNRLAARFYHGVLRSPEGRPGQEYFSGRRLTPQTIVKYGLGYAPNTWNTLRDYLRSKGFRDEQMYEAGLLNKGKSGSYYDAFRNRVMFPIVDLRKNVIGFGGRVLDDSKPKYLNTNDTLVFKKSRNLFSLNFAKNKIENGRLILAEGYMDVIAVNQAGFENVVATLGTALTPEQAQAHGGLRQGGGHCLRLRRAGTEGHRPGRGPAGRSRDHLPDAENVRGQGPRRIHQDLRGPAVQAAAGRRGECHGLPALPDPGQMRPGHSRGQEPVPYRGGQIPGHPEKSRGAGGLRRGAGQQRPASSGRRSSPTWSRPSNAITARKRRRNGRTSRARRTFYGDRVNPQRAANFGASRAEEGILAYLFRNPGDLGRLLEKIDENAFVTDFNRELFRIMKEKLQNNNGVALSDFTGELSPEQLARLTAIVESGNPHGGVGSGRLRPGLAGIPGPGRRPPRRGPSRGRIVEYGGTHPAAEKEIAVRNIGK